MWERLTLPFDHRLADSVLLSKLQLLHDQLYGNHIDLAVPVSFLIGKDGRMAGIYRGPLNVDQLLEDVQHIGDEAAARRARALPWPGRWYEKPPALNYAQIADAFEDNGFSEDAVLYLTQAIQEKPKKSEYHAKLGLRLMNLDRMQPALQALQKAVRLDPRNVAAHNHLGNL